MDWSVWIPPPRRPTRRSFPDVSDLVRLWILVNREENLSVMPCEMRYFFKMISFSVEIDDLLIKNIWINVRRPSFYAYA